MKKIFIGFLVIIFVVSLTVLGISCMKEAPPAVEEVEEVEEEVEEAVEEPVV